MAKKKKLPKGRLKKTAIEMTADALNIENTPDNSKGKKTHRGKKFGLPITKFMHNLFEINETLPRTKKMTDNEIRRQMIVEYHEYPKTVDYYRQSVNAIMDSRQHYNRGRWFGRHPPKLLSFRYNERGQRVYHGKNNVMSDELILKYRARYTASYCDEPGIFIPHIEIQEWMLPADNPLVLELFNQRIEAIEKRRETVRKKNARRELEES